MLIMYSEDARMEKKISGLSNKLFKIIPKGNLKSERIYIKEEAKEQAL